MNDFLHIQSETESVSLLSDTLSLPLGALLRPCQTLCCFRSMKRNKPWTMPAVVDGRVGKADAQRNVIYFLFFCFRHQQSVSQEFMVGTRFRFRNNATNTASCRDGHFIVKSIK